VVWTGALRWKNLLPGIYKSNILKGDKLWDMGAPLGRFNMCLVEKAGKDLQLYVEGIKIFKQSNELLVEYGMGICFGPL